MEAVELHRRIEDVWDRLPTIFTVYDVCSALRIPVGNSTKRVALHAVLDQLVSEGRLFPSAVVVQHSGRRPSAWSKTQDGLPEEIVLRTVREVLTVLPRRFSLEDVMITLKMGQRSRLRVRGAIKHLESKETIVRLTDLPHEVGRRTIRWSAHPDDIAAERVFRTAQQEARERAGGAWSEGLLDRMGKPFNPFSE